MTDSLSPVALSRLTWTAHDRRAWDETYRSALVIDAARSLVPSWTHDGWTSDRPSKQFGSAWRDEARYSVHADNYGKGQS